MFEYFPCRHGEGSSPDGAGDSVVRRDQVPAVVGQQPGGAGRRRGLHQVQLGMIMNSAANDPSVSQSITVIAQLRWLIVNSYTSYSWGEVLPVRILMVTVLTLG